MGGTNSRGELVAPTRLKVRLNRCFTPRPYELKPSAVAVGARFIAVISGCLTLCTFVPINAFAGNSVNASTSFGADSFATTTVHGPYVITSAAAHCTTCNRQFSLHLPMICLVCAFTCSIRNTARKMVVSLSGCPSPYLCLGFVVQLATLCPHDVLRLNDFLLTILVCQRQRRSSISGI
jgi:hypothetical protein